MRQTFVGRSTGIFGVSWPTTPRYCVPCEFHFWTNVPELGTCPIAAPGVFNNLVVSLDTAPGGGASSTFTIYVNGVATALTVTIAGGALTARDTTHSVHVNVGDTVSAVHTPAGLPAIPGVVNAAVEFVGDVAGRSTYGVGGGTPATGRQVRALFNYDPVWDVTGQFAYNLVSTPGTVTTYNIVLASGPGVGNSLVFALLRNGVRQDGTGGTVDTQLTLAGSATTGTWTGALPLTRGDLVQIAFLITGTPSYDRTAHGVDFLADTPDRSIICGVIQDTQVSGTLARYSIPTAGDQTAVNVWYSTEPPAQMPTGISPINLAGLFVRVDPFPGAGGSGARFDFTARKNGADTPLTAAVIETAITGDDSTHAIALADGDVWDLACVPTNGRASTVSWTFFQEDVPVPPPVVPPPCGPPTTPGIGCPNDLPPSASTGGAGCAGDLSSPATMEWAA